MYILPEAAGISPAGLARGSSHERYGVSEETDDVDPMQDLQAFPPGTLQVHLKHSTPGLIKAAAHICI